MIERGDVKHDSNDERISQRLINGVRVIEKETHRIIKLVGGRYVDASAKSEPRLVVVDDGDADPASFITKERTSLADLNALIGNITGQRA